MDEATVEALVLAFLEGMQDSARTRGSVNPNLEMEATDLLEAIEGDEGDEDSRLTATMFRDAFRSMLSKGQISKGVNL